MKIKRGVFRAAMACLPLFLACSDDGGGPPPGRGSPACNEWQGAYCGLLGRCQSANSACEQIKGIACKSDAEAKRCAGFITSIAGCSPPPADCDFPAIADPEPAKKACTEFQTILCQRNEECQPGSRDVCLQQVKENLDCTRAIGVAMAYENCVSSVRSLACNSPMAPEICKGIVLLL